MATISRPDIDFHGLFRKLGNVIYITHKTSLMIKNISNESVYKINH